MAKLLIRFIGTRINYNPWYCATYCHDKFLHSNRLTGTSNIRKTIYKNEEVKKIRVSIITKYLEYVKNYENVIEKKFPTAMHLYRTFKIGMKEFYSDLKFYLKIVRTLNSSIDGLKSLSLQEIELYFKMPRDMKKVGPILVLLALPGTNYIIFPITYYYPRQFLCSHFWTLQQRSEFNTYYLKQRLLHNRPTFRSLQAELKSLKESPSYQKWRHILGLLGSGVHPTMQEIIECKDLFSDQPYSINYLKGNHIKHLLKMHDLHPLVFKRSRLLEHARLLRAMDRAIDRENGVENLSQDALKRACMMRGFNSINVKHEDLIDWLKQWLYISRVIDNHNLSLLLHCPILLGYNQPSNWSLIY